MIKKNISNSLNLKYFEDMSFTDYISTHEIASLAIPTAACFFVFIKRVFSNKRTKDSKSSRNFVTSSEAIQEITSNGRASVADSVSSVHNAFLPHLHNVHTDDVCYDSRMIGAPSLETTHKQGNSRSKNNPHNKEHKNNPNNAFLSPEYSLYYVDDTKTTNMMENGQQGHSFLGHSTQLANGRKLTSRFWLSDYTTNTEQATPTNPTNLPTHPTANTNNPTNEQTNQEPSIEVGTYLSPDVSKHENYQDDPQNVSHNRRPSELSSLSSLETDPTYTCTITSNLNQSQYTPEKRFSFDNPEFRFSSHNTGKQSENMRETAHFWTENHAFSSNPATPKKQDEISDIESDSQETPKVLDQARKFGTLWKDNKEPQMDTNNTRKEVSCLVENTKQDILCLCTPRTEDDSLNATHSYTENGQTLKSECFSNIDETNEKEKYSVDVESKEPSLYDASSSIDGLSTFETKDGVFSRISKVGGLIKELKSAKRKITGKMVEAVDAVKKMKKSV